MTIDEIRRVRPRIERPGKTRGSPAGDLGHGRDEDFDRAGVIAKDAKVPFAAIEMVDRDAGIVLNDDFAVIQNEIADSIEAALEHQIRR